MPTMNVSLPEDLANFVMAQVDEENGYTSQSEVVRDALRLMRQRSEKIRVLRDALDVGLSDVRAGRTEPLTESLLREITSRAKAPLSKKRRVPKS